MTHYAEQHLPRFYRMQLRAEEGRAARQNIGPAPLTPRSARDQRDHRRLAAMLILQRDGSHCYLCKTELTAETATIEHIIPIAYGGTDSPENVGVACVSCNSTKHQRAVSVCVTSGRPVYHVIR